MRSPSESKYNINKSRVILALIKEFLIFMMRYLKGEGVTYY